MTDMIPELIAQLNASTMVADVLAERLDSLQTDMQRENERLATEAKAREQVLRDEATAREGKARHRLLALAAAVLAVAVLITLLSLGYHGQQKLLDRQDCLNRANDVRNQTALAFYEREVRKLYLQAAGFQQLLDSATAGNQTGARTGFQRALTATHDAALGNAKVLTQLGVKTVAQANGNVNFEPIPNAPGAVKC